MSIDPIIVLYLLANIGIAIYVSRLAGKKINPPWLGYILGFIVGSFVGRIIYQLINLGIIWFRFISNDNPLGYSLFELVLIPVINMVLLLVIGSGLTIVLVILWRRGQH